MPASPTILAIDTSTGPCSVALLKDGAIAAYEQDLRTVTQSVSLMPMVERVLKTGGAEYADLTLVAATIGPGSFTGIRVGLAAARAICFSAGIAGIGVTTLDVLAFAAKEHAENDKVLGILNAGKGEWYYQGFDLSAGFSRLHAPLLGTIEAATQSMSGATIAGNSPASTCPITFPKADALALLAAAHSAEIDSGMHPFYLRAPDAKPQKLTNL